MKIKYGINVEEICDVAYNGLEALEAVEKDFKINKENVFIIINFSQLIYCFEIKINIYHPRKVLKI